MAQEWSTSKVVQGSSKLVIFVPLVGCSLSRLCESERAALRYNGRLDEMVGVQMRRAQRVAAGLSTVRLMPGLCHASLSRR